MDNKKLLLVSVSVGLFLIIIIGASMLAFAPKKYSALDAIRAEERNDGAPVSPDGRDFDPRDAGVSPVPPPVPYGAPSGAAETGNQDMRGADGYPPLTITTLPQSDIHGNSENFIYVYGGDGEVPARVERLSDGSTKTYINVGPKSGAPAKSGGNDVAEVTFTPENRPEKYPPATMAAAKKESRPVVRPEAAKRERSPVKSVNRGSNYWVQTGSFKSKNRADNAKDFLAGKGITSIVFDSKVNGQTVYRVRVGPYTSKSEADYWLSLIKEIDGMENSQVWKSPG